MARQINESIKGQVKRVEESRSQALPNNLLRMLHAESWNMRSIFDILVG